MATPVLWAAKKCNYYVVDLLLKNGADPLLTDDQGFNLFHSAALDGNVYQITLLLHQDIPVDVPDSHGHTGLMWAAYKGFPAVVDVLLEWGANVYARDSQGFTALHWALVKGHRHCIFRLIEYGSDRFAETNDGKSPAVVAKEMNSVRQWYGALADCNYNPDGSLRQFPLASIVKDKRMFYSRLFFLWPFFVVFVCLYIISHLVVYLAFPLAFLIAYGLQMSIRYLFRWAPPDMKGFHRTVSLCSPISFYVYMLTKSQPFLAGVFAGTLFLVGVRWLTKILLSKCCYRVYF